MEQNKEWSALKIDKGRVKQGTTLDYVFEYNGNKTIVDAKPYCSCTSVRVDGKKVLVNLSTSISHQLKEQEYNKGLNAFFSDGTWQELRVLATVTK